MNLYQIKQEYIEALNKLEADEETGEIQGIENLIWIDGLREEKLLNYGKAVKIMDDEIHLISIEIERLEKMREKSVDKKIRLEEMITANLKDDQKLSDMHVSLSYRKSKAIEITSEKELPKEFFRTKTLITPDKIAIRDAIEKGASVSGAAIVERKKLVVK